MFLFDRLIYNHFILPEWLNEFLLSVCFSSLSIYPYRFSSRKCGKTLCIPNLRKYTYSTFRVSQFSPRTPQIVISLLKIRPSLAESQIYDVELLQIIYGCY